MVEDRRPPSRAEADASCPRRAGGEKDDRAGRHPAVRTEVVLHGPHVAVPELIRERGKPQRLVEVALRRLLLRPHGGEEVDPEARHRAERPRRAVRGLARARGFAGVRCFAVFGRRDGPASVRGCPLVTVISLASGSVKVNERCPVVLLSLAGPQSTPASPRRPRNAWPSSAPRTQPT